MQQVTLVLSLNSEKYKGSSLVIQFLLQIIVSRVAMEPSDNYLRWCERAQHDTLLSIALSHHDESGQAKQATIGLKTSRSA